MRRLAQQLLGYGAACAAGGIALASAFEAWNRLQPGGGYTGLAGELIVVVALPLLAIGAGLLLSWLVRRLAGRGLQPSPDPAPFSPLPPGEPRPPGSGRPGRDPHSLPPGEG